MAKRRRSVKSRKSSRRRRRNGAGLGRTAFLALMAKGKARKAGKRRKTKSSKRRKTSKRRRSVSGKRIRPVIISKAGKYYRPRRSKYFKTARRVNGRRRRANGAAGKLLSTVKGMFKVPSLLRYASIGGGIFGGTLLSKLLNTGLVPFTSIALPASVTSALAKVRPAHGLIHILAGTVIASKARNKHIKDAALGLAALGSFDLLMQVLAMAGMKNLPTFSGMNIDLRGLTQYNGMTYPGAMYGKMPTQAGMNVDLRGRRTRAMAGLNVDLLGESRHRDAESSHLADNINDMIS
jgi:hypothetical protein